MEEFIYRVNDKEYRVLVIRKKIKNIHYRFVDGVFKISCNRYISNKELRNGLDKFALKLINCSSKETPICDDYIYLYGVKVPLENEGQILFSDNSCISYISKEDLLKKLKNFFLTYMKNRVGYYSTLMNLPLYKVTVRDMKTRFGSNSKHTKTLHFSTILMHYSPGTIDSVVVHELAHILHYDHSKKFYDVVYKYCPDYDLHRKKLIKGDYL